MTNSNVIASGILVKGAIYFLVAEAANIVWFLSGLIKGANGIPGHFANRFCQLMECST
jgi:hypothetical protein